MAGDPYGYLRSCAGCSAHLLTYQSNDRDDVVLCRKCEKGLQDGEEQLAGAYPRFSLYGHRNSQEFVLLFRDGDKLVVRQLGRPDADSFETTVAMVRPRFSYAKLNRVQAEERRARGRARARR